MIPSNETLLGRALRLPLRFIPRGRDVRILSGPLAGARWVVGRGTHGCWLGTYERHVQAVFERYVCPGSTVLDVGAHFGFYSLLAARLVGDDGRVVAFEPMPPTIAGFRTHLAVNPALAWRITLIESAVGDHDGEAVMGFEDSPASASIHPLDPVTKQLTVPLVTLDALYAAGRIASPVSFIKIDVEGAEVDVLRGAAQLLAAERPTLVVSCHSAAWHTEVDALLRGAGYSTTAVDGRAPNLGRAADLLALP